MPMSDIERQIRFSKLLPEDYSSIRTLCETQLLETLQYNPHFLALCESSNAKVKSKEQLVLEAKKLSTNSEPIVAKLGKAILKVLLEGARYFANFCMACSAVIVFVPLSLAICLEVIVGVLLFCLVSIPIGVIKTGITEIEKALGLIEKKDSNIIKIDKVVRDIKSQTKNIDMKQVAGLVKVSESLLQVRERPHSVTDGTNDTAIFESIRLLNLIDTMEVANSKEDSYPIRIALYENLAPEYLTAKSSVSMESASMDGTQLFVTLEDTLNAPLLSGNGLVNGIISITTEACNDKTAIEFLSRYKDTVLYEMTNENYNDLPIIMETGYALSYVREKCKDLPEILESCDYLDGLLGEIITECETSVSEDAAQFNPDPFSIGSLTPLPVADRAIGGALCDIEDAETDEEIAEAMINLGRIMNVVQENYYVDDNDFIIVREGIGKVARNVETKANKVFSKLAIKDKAKGVKAAVKHAVDPMEKFVTDKYKKVKQADSNERREIIMKGGTVPKVLRWIKRGIGLLITGAVGTVFAPAALITGITFIGFIASDKALDKKERAKIMRELDDEIMICNEKIDDSRGDDNKKKKYELMRIRNNLQRQRDRIRYNLSE